MEVGAATQRSGVRPLSGRPPVRGLLPRTAPTTVGFCRGDLSGRIRPTKDSDPIRAWQFMGINLPLTLNEIPEPRAGAGEVVVDIRAAGLCHSDLGILTNESFLPPFVRPPLTIGHEIAGVVSEVGEGVTGWTMGDRVGVCQIGDDVTGITKDGGYAPKVLVNADVLLRIPEGVSFEQAAAGNDAGMTAHHAMVVDGADREGAEGRRDRPGRAGAGRGAHRRACRVRGLRGGDQARRLADRRGAGRHPGRRGHRGAGGNRSGCDRGLRRIRHHDGGGDRSGPSGRPGGAGRSRAAGVHDQHREPRDEGGHPQRLPRRHDGRYECGLRPDGLGCAPATPVDDHVRRDSRRTGETRSRRGRRPSGRQPARA